MRKQMNEDRGVPEGLTSYATLIFNSVLGNLKRNNFQQGFSGFFATIPAQGTFLKDDKPVQINRIKVSIDFDFYPSNQVKSITKANPENKTKTDELILTGLAMEFITERDLTKSYNLKIIPNLSPTLFINFLASEDLDDIQDKVYDLLNDNYDEIITTFGHELQHHINTEAKGEDDVALRAKYNVVSNPGVITNNKTLNDFLFNLYYLSLIENIVRPSEFKTELDNKKVTKEQFKQIYYNSEMYNKFEICEKTTYEKLYADLSQELSKTLPNQTLNATNKDSVILDVLQQTIARMVTVGVEYLTKLIEIRMPNAPADEMASVFGNKFEVFLKKHMFVKYKPSKNINTKRELDVEKTYRSIIKDMNITATKMKKKISKLYADIPYEY